MKHLHIDIETYSSVDLKTSGVYKYADSIDFEILCIAWSYGEDVLVCDWKDLPAHVIADLQDPNIKKLAHNASFERVCLSAMGLNVGNEWQCTAVLASYNGLPLSLKGVSEALELGDKAKSSTGAALIRYFCVPCKPTKTNGHRTRNLPEHDLEKYNEFKEYCKQDVVAECAIFDILKHNPLTDFEQKMYELDQRINDNGITVDIEFINSVLHLNAINREHLIERAKILTGLDNPNSPVQLQKWIEDQTGTELPNLTKGTLADLDFEDERVMDMIRIRQRLSKTSIKKYNSMLACAMDDSKVRGLFQFYGAHTGRWAGRLVQVQNLPRNYIKDLDATRQIVKSRDYELLDMLFSDMQDTLSQLIRTSFIPSRGRTHLTLSDYSAIEARVLAWLANEKWRMDLFSSKEDRDIYSESASRMFNVPLGPDGRLDSVNRQKGKIAELALGYQGGWRALDAMGAAKAGLSETEMKSIVIVWRKANTAIVDFWGKIHEAAMESVKYKKKVVLGMFIFETDDRAMLIRLPSGRTLSYWKARIHTQRTMYGQIRDSIQYMWSDAKTRKWTWVDSYGGKIVENITQAIARDFMAEALIRVDEQGFKIAMHVHDEIVVEDGQQESLEKLMQILPEWAKDFPLDAKGEQVKYFQK